MIPFRPLPLALAASLFAFPAPAQTPEEVAAAALEAAPIWDGHNDLPIQLRARRGNMLDHFDLHDTTDEPPRTQGGARGAMHTDLPRLRQGRVGAQWWSVFVSANQTEAEAVEAVLEQIDVTKRLIARYPDDLTLALTADDVATGMAQGKIAGMLGMEGGHAIGSSLAVLRQMYGAGARYMTLTHSLNTSWADSATDDPEHGGLTDFGVKVVQEMNRLGMLVDLSHVSEATMHDALDSARAPVIFSHSGVRAVNDHSRNVPDSVLARLPDNGGIVMVVFLRAYVLEDLRQHLARRRGEEARLEALYQGRLHEIAAPLAAWDAANPEPEVRPSHVADHIDHIRRLVGVDHIGIGGDYDGMPPGPVGMEDVSGYPLLFEELARRGYTQEELEKISSRNMMRVMRAAEAYAASQRGMEPIETPVS